MITDIIVLLILAIATGAGIGGGGLLVVYLTMFRNFDQVSAQAINLAFFILSAFASAAVQRKRGNLHDLKSIVFCATFAIPGVICGTLLRNKLTGDTLSTIFGILLLITGGVVLFREIKAKINNRSKKADKSF